MLGKYKTASILVILVLAYAAALATAPTYINKVELSRDGSFTLLTIKGNGQLQYAHESVEAKEGKPFRIVIDCLASRHNLPQKGFTDLPRSIISSIRTAQYSVEPEEVVRVVLDLNEESVYRVEADGNSIKVFVSDQKTAPFKQWSSASVPKTVLASTPAVKTKDAAVQKTKPAPAEEKQLARATSPKPQSSTSVPSQKPPVVKRNEKKETQSAYDYVKLPAPTNNEDYGPSLATVAKSSKNQPETKKVEKPTVKSTPVKPSVTAEIKGREKNQPPVVAKTEVKKNPIQPAVKKSQPTIKKDLAKDSIEKAKYFAVAGPEKTAVPEPGVTTEKVGPNNKDAHKATPVKPEPVKEKIVAEKPPLQKSETVKKVSADKPAVKKSKPVKEEVVLASTEPVNQKPAAPEMKNDDQIEKIRTSKYRRESARSAEYKSTQVVQFPQRMVIKYKRTNSRDPFKSLILAEKDRKGNYDLSMIPNVEALDLVGILEPEAGKGAALMEDRDGIGYILRPGDKVKNGYVAQVDDNAVYFRVNEYGWGRTIVKHMEKDN